MTSSGRLANFRRSPLRRFASRSTSSFFSSLNQGRGQTRLPGQTSHEATAPISPSLTLFGGRPLTLQHSGATLGYYLRMLLSRSTFSCKSLIVPMGPRLLQPPPTPFQFLVLLVLLLISGMVMI